MKKVIFVIAAIALAGNAAFAQKEKSNPKAELIQSYTAYMEQQLLQAGMEKERVKIFAE